MKRIFRITAVVWGLVVLPTGLSAQDDVGLVPGSGYQYFPTERETGYTFGSDGGREYSRGGGGGRIAEPSIGAGVPAGGLLGPDNASLTRTGLWETDSPEENFYERHGGFFRPMENFLWLFARNEGTNYSPYIGRSKDSGEADYVDADFETVGGVSVDFGLPFTRAFDPERAHFKAGPLYFDLLTVSATALYSDFNGGTAYAGLPDDGWTGIVSLTSRALIRLTDNLYLAAITSVYYLPDSNEVGFYFGQGNSIDSALNAHIAWDKQIGEWELLVYDQFRAYYRLFDLYDDVEVDEIDTSGRYRFGRFDPQNGIATSYFDGNDISTQVYFVNDVGFSLFRDDVNDWRLRGTVFRRDVWTTTDFDHQDAVYYGSVQAMYDRQDWRLAPFAEYRVRAVDDFDSFTHDVWLGVRGPITQNLSLLARAGYTWRRGTVNDSEHFLWEVGLNHIISSTTQHSIYGGQTVDDGNINDRYLANYLRYTLAHNFGARLMGNVYGQIAEIENQDFPRGQEGTLWSAGARLTYALGDFANVTAGLKYEEIDRDFVVGSDSTRWIYNIRYTQRLLSRLWASALWQYEQFDSSTSARDFDEQLVSLTLTRYF